jgi:hypothetical protein
MDAVTPIRGQNRKEQQSVPPTPADISLVPSLVTAGKLYPTIAPATANLETTNVGSPTKVTHPAPSKRTGEMLILQPTFQQATKGLWTIKTAICSTNIYDYIKTHSQDGKSINMSKIFIIIIRKLCCSQNISHARMSKQPMKYKSLSLSVWLVGSPHHYSIY